MNATTSVALMPVCVLWLWSVFAFARWRLPSGAVGAALEDWAVQLYLRATGLLLLAAIVLLALLQS